MLRKQHPANKKPRNIPAPGFNNISDVITQSRTPVVSSYQRVNVILHLGICDIICETLYSLVLFIYTFYLVCCQLIFSFYFMYARQIQFLPTSNHADKWDRV